MKKIYSIVRKREESDMGSLYKYFIGDFPMMYSYTNYHRGAAYIYWHAEINHRYEVKQKNKYYRFLEFIPVINTIYAWFYSRKYEVLLDDKLVGYSDMVKVGRILERERVMVNGIEYINKAGNTSVKRPGKDYEWTIETSTGHKVAIITKRRKDEELAIEFVDEKVDLEIVIILVMMADMTSFSPERTGQVSMYD
ncbi:hypothetical protein M2454_002450 [Aequitasia blattaphilus]|uniref:Uncharacterized protein n=1 Tax=Aequitasia blattaphilus TaxID=2949332 RepID=A0ABT1EF34_9FIRM|nr:hypothetical protein [Aequitasia blattaphilus]MCP1103072.1 hypothetical protein [Aequitasia blattaphilus]MCR8615712.1 hypothetical protein [Aequitasia blattaphilus]